MIGKKIKELRETKGLTQKELADKLGLSDGAIGFYETERRNPPIEILNKLADFFDVSVDYLLGRTEIPNLYKEKDVIEKKKKELDEYFTLQELEEFLYEKRKIQ